MTEQLPVHSPLGGSAASRFIICPGSVTLAQGISDDDDDGEFSKPGSAAHAVAELCLAKNRDAWEYIGSGWDGKQLYDWHQGADVGESPGDILIDKEMVDAVQVYVRDIRFRYPERTQKNSWIERRFHCPSIHKFFYGTSDYIYFDRARRVLHVHDYKHGAGIIVEVKNNAQCMYYAIGALEDLGLWEEVDTVVLHIAQPRGFHFDGPLRSWSLSVADLKAWGEDVLLPAMDKALVSRDTVSGEHCRFCPVRFRACPQILADFDELEKFMPQLLKDGGADELSNEQVARFLDLLAVAKIAGTAASKTAFRRLNAGHAIPGYKLAKAKANREWKPEAFSALTEKFGPEALTVPVLKSPAQIEELPEGEKFTARYAFKPDRGLTVVKGEDTRPAVSRDTKSLFQDVTKKGKK